MLSTRRQGRSFQTIAGKTVARVDFGSEGHMPTLGSYGAYTLTMTDGTRYIIWNSYGELNIDELMERTDDIR